MRKGKYIRTKAIRSKTRKTLLGKNVGEKSGVWKGDEIKLGAKHYRIRKLKGKASKQLCVDCGEKAYDWSNCDHKYSLNPDDYSPRCRKCHWKYDIKFN